MSAKRVSTVVNLLTLSNICASQSLYLFGAGEALGSWMKWIKNGLMLMWS